MNQVATIEQKPSEAKAATVQQVSPISASPMDIDPKQFKAALRRRKRNRDALMDWVRDSLVLGTDYMRVWSKKRREWSKYFLTKAGAEKVLAMLGVSVTYPNLNAWEEKVLRGDAIETVMLRCELINSAGVVIGSGVGGRLVKSQDYGDINKSIKMAEKSAMIDATLRLAGLSEVFTQDPDSADDDNIVPSINKQQLAHLTALCAEGPLKPKDVADYFGVNELSDLPADQLFRAEKAIRKANEKAKGEQS